MTITLKCFTYLPIPLECFSNWNDNNDVDRLSSVAAANSAIFSKQEWDEFLSLQKKVITDITNVQPYNKLPFLTSRIKSMLDYNLTGGTISSGLNTVYTYKMISKPEDRTPKNIELAVLMGWCLRFYEAAIIIMDDLLDNAPMRYKVQAWHSLPHIGKDAALHSVLIETCMHFLIQKYFSKHPQYKNILEIFLTSFFYLNYSQFLDTTPYHEDNLTQEFFEGGSFGKFERTTFYLSFTLAMYLADIRNPELYEKVQKVSAKLGTWLHIQNDYLDAFDLPDERPIGTDIKEAKISWLSINAFHKCDPIQKELFRRNYGNYSEDSINKIMNLYKELQLPKLYEDTERKLHDEILKEIEDIPRDIIPHDVFFRSINSLKNRLVKYII